MATTQIRVRRAAANATLDAVCALLNAGSGSYPLAKVYNSSGLLISTHNVLDAYVVPVDGGDGLDGYKEVVANNVSDSNSLLTTTIDNFELTDKDGNVLCSAELDTPFKVSVVLGEKISIGTIYVYVPWSTVIL